MPRSINALESQYTCAVRALCVFCLCVPDLCLHVPITNTIEMVQPAIRHKFLAYATLIQHERTDRFPGTLTHFVPGPSDWKPPPVFVFVLQDHLHSVAILFLYLLFIHLR